MVINEFADASGTGNYIYEFVELHNDSTGGGDTQAPATAITAPANGATVSGTVSVTASASDNVGVTRVEFFLDGVLQSHRHDLAVRLELEHATASERRPQPDQQRLRRGRQRRHVDAVQVTVSNGTDNVGG